MFRKILFNFHKILGILLSLLFLIWFLSGFVMIYHGFPKVSEQDRIAKKNVISGILPGTDDVISLLSDTARLQSLSLDMYFDRPAFHFQGQSVPPALYADSFIPLEEISFSSIERTADQWCTAPVAQVDTMRELNQWIPFGRLKNEFPIYKFIFADEERHELYISSKTGNILQYTNKNQRFWAWLGAIPHFVYFTFLRQNQPLWINLVKWASGIGCIMCLLGIVLALHIAWRRKKLKSPYKKRWFHLHYMSGLLFGVFAITFAFSGLMSLTDLPDWLKKKPKAKQETIAPERHGRGRRGGGMRSGGSLAIDSYQLDYRLALKNTKGAKSIEWASWQDKPYYKITTEKEVFNIDASNSKAIRPFVLTEKMVYADLKRIYGEDTKYSVTLLTEYDKDYFFREKMWLRCQFSGLL